MLSVEERAGRLLQTLPPAVQGSGGSAQAQSVCFKLVQGLAMEPETAAVSFKADYNHKCIPPFSDAEILKKCRDSLKVTPREGRGFLLANKGSSTSNYVAPVKAAPVSKPKPKLFVSNERKPTIAECMEIAKSRNLPGPGVIVAAALGVLRVGEMFGHRVWGIGDADGPLVNVRRMDGERFPGYKGNDPIKSFTLVSGSECNRPYGYCKMPKLMGIALVEGAPDFLAMLEQIVWESKLDAFKIEDVSHIRERLDWLPLMMLSATSKLDPGSSYLGDFRSMKVLLVPHPEKLGIDGAERWFNAIKPVAESVSALDCARVRGSMKDDFNDVFNLIDERILPL